MEQANGLTETGGLPALLPLSRQREAARLARLMHRLAWAVATIVTLLIPASYFVVGYSYEARHLLTEASLQGASLSQAGKGALAAWQADPEALEVLLPLSADAHKDVAYRIIDAEGHIVAVIGFAQQDPILTRGSLLTFDDGNVALLEVQRSLLPLLSRTAIAAAIGIALATVLLLIFWLLPMRIINGVFNRLARSEGDLVLARDHAESANRAKSEFLAVMSHELRTPLNAIIGFAEMMQRSSFGPLGNKRYEEYVGDIHMSGRHLLEMVNDILDLTKAEVGKLDLFDDSVDVAETGDAACRMVAPLARTKDIVVSNRIARSLPMLRGDERRLTQIMLNFVSNAVKFSNDGGRVELDAFLDEDGSLAVMVRDNGIGIADADIPRVMQIFQQADNSHTRRHGGTGLGLPLAKKLIELHGGSLVMESKLGLGTRVIARFPASRVIAVAEEPAANVIPLVRAG